MPPSPCTISTALLVPQDRVPRLPVPDWAGRLRAALAETARGERRGLRFAEVTGTIANQAALVAAFQGAADRAAELCRAQMTWQGRMSRRSGEADVARLGVQPWVNLGRLEAMAGECDAALERFARLVQPGADGRLCLGSARIAPSGRSVEQQEERFGGFLRNVYVADSLKALLMSRRWDEVLAFARRVEGDAANAMRADEARVIAFCRLGDPLQGAEIADARRTASFGWTRMVFALRRAEALGCAGEMDEARAQLSRLCNTLNALSPEARTNLGALYVLVRVAQVCVEMGAEEDARALALAAAEAAATAEDEVLRIEALRVLRDIDAGDTGDALDSLEALEAETGFARYRRGARPPLFHPETDALYAELSAVLAA